MALKALLLKKQIDNKRKALDALRAKDADFTTREAELTQAIDEVETEEQRSAVDEMVTAFETEKADHAKAVGDLEREIEGLESDLAAEEAAQNTEPAGDPAPAQEEKREDDKNMNTREKHSATRARVYGDMTVAEQRTLIEREDVRSFLDGIKNTIRGAQDSKQTRAITNVGLLIPEVMLGLLRENVLRYSKLYRHVTVSRVNGEGRILISGGIPEAVWTECCARLNELNMTFYQDAFGCWKLGGYFTVCNANLEDSDIDLMAEILLTLGQSLGYTDDKTILYGTGTNMPQGIIPRLPQTSQPAGYPATARPWVDLHTSNIKTIASTVTGIALFQKILTNSAIAKAKYARNPIVWVMNETTRTALMAEALAVNAAGAMVSGLNNTMPVVGGPIEVLEFIPDNVIIFGYFELYLLAERKGQQFATSEHVLFLADQTVMKGTARYDGGPMIAEAFGVLGIGGTTPNATMTFASDTANT
jgi:HK97 family phage major capsid protein